MEKRTEHRRCYQAARAAAVYFQAIPRSNLSLYPDVSVLGRLVQHVRHRRKAGLAVWLGFLPASECVLVVVDHASHATDEVAVVLGEARCRRDVELSWST